MAGWQERQQTVDAGPVWRARAGIDRVIAEQQRVTVEQWRSWPRWGDAIARRPEVF